MNDTIEYPYDMKFFPLLIVLVMFVPTGFGFSRIAMTNDRGLILNHVIHFSTQGATILYWVIAFFFIFFSFLFFLSLISILVSRGKFFVRLTPMDIEIPKGFPIMRMTRILLQDIKRLELLNSEYGRLLVIEYHHKKANLSQMCFQKKEDFNNFCTKLAARVGKNAR